MDTKLEDKYSNAYASLAERIALRKSEKRLTAMGFTSNLDLLCNFDVDHLNRLLEENIPNGSLTDFKAASIISSIHDLLETIVFYCANGIGGEVDIENTDVVRNSFEFTNGMGGTAVQAALALAEISGESLVHLTDDSREVCELLDSPHIFVALEGGTIGHTDQVRQQNEQELHFIIQFQQGNVIRLKDQQIKIPVSNRLILTKTTVNKTIPLWTPYFQWIEQHAEQVSSNVLSSFNCVLDPEVLMERLDFVKAHIQRYHRCNPNGIVYFEDAHYHDINIRRLCLETLYSCVDIVGMNEEELKYTLNDMYHFNIDINNILSCVEGAEYLINKFHIKKGIVIHTKDYGMYVGVPLDVDIQSGIMYGNITATAKAVNGWYGNAQQILDVLKLDMSPKGVEKREIIENSGYKGKAILVPSKYIEDPRYTIGLGDSFVGGLQMCF